MVLNWVARMGLNQNQERNHSKPIGPTLNLWGRFVDRAVVVVDVVVDVVVNVVVNVVVGVVVVVVRSIAPIAAGSRVAPRNLDDPSVVLAETPIVPPCNFDDSSVVVLDGSYCRKVCCRW